MLKVIDLSKADKHTHPDINIGKDYLARIYGRWHLGRFNEQWYGLNFVPWLNGVGIQFDAPGYNRSGWQKLIEIDLNKLDVLGEEENE